jgi:hypothetical protein
VAPHARRLFQLSAKVVHDPRYLADDVEAAVRTRLEADFGYQARSLAQPVSAAEVIAAIQGVAGVDHVDLDALQPYREDEPALAPSLASVLPAFPARLGAGTPAEILPAELLTVLSPAITLSLEAADG